MYLLEWHYEQAETVAKIDGNVRIRFLDYFIQFASEQLRKNLKKTGELDNDKFYFLGSKGQILRSKDASK